MKTQNSIFFTLFLFFLFIHSFSFSQNKKNEIKTSGTGNLFIIGGGDRTDSLMKDLIKTAGIGKDDYVIILPMSSEEPDSSIFYAKEDFNKLGINKVIGYNFKENESVDKSKLDSLKKAKLIYISGGDQTRFMKVVKKGPIYDAIHYAYHNGSTIAGTSAGAAVMSRKMITGNALKYPEYTGEYPTIEPDNIEIIDGLGLVENLIIDQHFIKRQRLNRLLAVCIENPKEICVGIDESTAIVVSKNKFRVTGENQVIVLKNKGKTKEIKGRLLAGKNIALDVLLPSETYNF